MLYKLPKIEEWIRVPTPESRTQVNFDTTETPLRWTSIPRRRRSGATSIPLRHRSGETSRRDFDTTEQPAQVKQMKKMSLPELSARDSRRRWSASTSASNKHRSDDWTISKITIYNHQPTWQGRMRLPKVNCIYIQIYIYIWRKNKYYI